MKEVFEAGFIAGQRATLLAELGRYEEAIVAFAEASGASPLDDNLRMAMSDAAVSADRYDEVLAAFDDAIDQRGGPKLAQ